MPFLLGFIDPKVLDGAAAGAVTGRFPELRLVSLVPREQIEAAVSALPAHLRMRVILDPPPELLASGEIQALVTEDPEATRRALADIASGDMVTWAQVANLYTRWLVEHHLPAGRRDMLTPKGLFPIGWRYDPMRIEVIGSCNAWRVHTRVAEVAAELGADISSYHMIQNHPGALDAPPTERPTVRFVMPPFRYMHPASMDDFFIWTDYERAFSEVKEHMVAYLESVREADPWLDLYVCGFLEPPMNPDGVFFVARELSNFRYFVRCMNDELVDWCADSTTTHFVDCQSLAATVGAVDGGVVDHFSHRASMDPGYDDGTDRECGFATVPEQLSYDTRADEYLRAIVREIVHRQVIRSGRARVKAVIFDLDNTMWRGVAADGTVGPFGGRPQALAEAVHILKRRGLYVAIASRNDEAWIRENWDDILYRSHETRLEATLSLEDFDAVRIDFRPKSETIAELLDDLAILPEHAVFVDDNPLEREQVQTAFPDMRILGAEINRVRLELVHSPFTQADTRTAEDTLRAQSVRRRAGLRRARAAGGGTDFLASLGLRCNLREVTDVASADGVRAVQLINKTNQWTLNALRTAPEELAAACDAGRRLLVAHVDDAYASHGLVAAALVDPSGGRVEAMVVSCRVIGMGIDDAIFAELLRRFGPLTVAFRTTDRNRAAEAALERWSAGPTSPESPIAEIERPSHVALVTGDAELALGAS